MLEAICASFAGLWLIAATTHRYRRDAGLATVRPWRFTGGVLLLLAFLLAGAPLTGERLVRFLGAVSISGVVLILLLSWRPLALFRPLSRWR